MNMSDDLFLTTMPIKEEITKEAEVRYITVRITPEVIKELFTSFRLTVEEIVNELSNQISMEMRKVLVK